MLLVENSVKISFTDLQHVEYLFIFEFDFLFITSKMDIFNVLITWYDHLNYFDDTVS